MSPETGMLEALSKKVSNLERRNRRLRLSSLAVLLAIGSVFFLGANNPQEGPPQLSSAEEHLEVETLTVRKIFIVDPANGFKRAELTADNFHFVSAGGTETGRIKNNCKCPE